MAHPSLSQVAPHVAQLEVRHDSLVDGNRGRVAGLDGDDFLDVIQPLVPVVRVTGQVGGGYAAVGRNRLRRVLLARILE